MKNKLAIILATILMLSNHSNSMENLGESQSYTENTREMFKFLDNPNSQEFTQATIVFFSQKNRTNSDIVNQLLKIEETTLSQRALLSICKLCSMNNYELIKFDYTEVFNILTEACEKYKECAFFLFSYARCFDFGIGTEKNIEKAIELFQKAADLQNSDAMNTLAIMYKNGNGVQKNLEKARGLFQKAADLQNSDAMGNLATMYKNGNGVQKNLEKAIELLQKASALNNPKAMNSLAIMHADGDGVEESLEKAIELFQKASDLGNPDAMNNLAIIYKDGNGLEKNLEKAIELFQKAADLGSSEAMNTLANMYEDGNELEKNLEKARELLQKAADLGNPTAMNNLALMYQIGNGVEKNLEKAIELFQKAVDLGNPTAMWNLGDLYEQEYRSKGNKENIEKAQTLMEKAFFLKDPYAQANLPFFLLHNQMIARLIEIEFEYPDLFPRCSAEFCEILSNEENTDIINTTIKSLIQKKYKELLDIFPDVNKVDPLKIQAENDLIHTIPKCVVLYKIAQDLDPGSLFALACASKHFRDILCNRVMKVQLILDELLRLKKAFMQKLEVYSVENQVDFEFLKKRINLEKILDMLCSTDEKREQK